MKVGVIDIGSNSIRYMLSNGDGSPICGKLNVKKKHSTGLGRGLDKTDMLDKARIDKTLEAAAEFVGEAEKAGADKICAFCTEAVRAAKNGGEFVKAFEAKLGFKPEVLSGDEEALVGYLGAADGYKKATVFDIGGASVELIIGEYGRIGYKKSLPLGCIRLRERFDGDFAALAEYLEKAVFEFAPPKDTGNLIGIGGTATAIGAMIACPKEYDPQKVHRGFIEDEDVYELIRDVKGMKDPRELFPALSENRAELIPYGLYVVAALIALTGTDGFTVSETDNMEGYLRYKATEKP